MVFASYQFIFLFLPITIFIYFMIGKKLSIKYQHIFLVIASLFFYAYFNLNYLFIILGSIIVNYLIARKMHKNHEYKKILLALGLIFNIGLLGYYKYLNFFVDSVNLILKEDLIIHKIVLPLGISFFTFQQISFIVDTYNDKNAKYDFLSYCLFVTFFPQLVAGPIVLPSEILPQFNSKNGGKINYYNMNKGLYIFAIGLAKKVIIADSIATYANVGFDKLANLTIIEAWLSTISYTMQLYFDFSGYCDIAIGIGLMFNIKLPINFNSPYKSLNIQEFWRKWHITLGRFLTNYLYIPLGGSKRGELNTLINTMIVFFISGLWHGAGVTFIVWGVLHGLAMVIYRIWRKIGIRINKILAWLITFNTINIFWIFFRAETLSNSIRIIRAMFNFNTLSDLITRAYVEATVTTFGNKITVSILMVSMLIAIVFPNIHKREEHKINFLTMCITVVCIVVSVLIMGEKPEFLYFDF